jgi:hypothetical protein
MYDRDPDALHRINEAHRRFVVTGQVSGWTLLDRPFTHAEMNQVTNDDGTFDVVRLVPDDTQEADLIGLVTDETARFLGHRRIDRSSGMDLAVVSGVVVR